MVDEIDKSIDQLIREGKVDSKGFDKEGNEIVSLNEEGLEYVIMLLRKDPSAVLFLLKVALSNSGSEGFYKMLNTICEECRKGEI